MRTASRVREIELTETGRLSRSIVRLNNLTNYKASRWKRSLVHAIEMAGVLDDADTKAVREALKLP